MTSASPHPLIGQVDLSQKPNISTKDVILLCKNLYGLIVTSVKEQNSYDDKNFYIKVEDHWANEFITQLWPHGYILKILNSRDSLKKHYVAEHTMQAILREKGFKCPNVVPNIYGKNGSLEIIHFEACNDNKDDCQNENSQPEDNKKSNTHLCRLFTFIPGKILCEVLYTPSLLYQLGQYMAKLHDTWKGFHHQDLANYRTAWNMTSIPELEAYVDIVENRTHREIVHSVLRTFQNEVLANCQYFQAGVIHGDISQNNVIVQEKPGQNDIPPDQREHDVHGIIDFGESYDTCYIFEIGVTMMYSSLDSKIIDPLLVGGYILAGYLSLRELNEKELDALRSIMAARYAQSLVMGLNTYLKNPKNTYTLQTSKNGWNQLEKLWTTPKETLYAKWREIINSLI